MDQCWSISVCCFVFKQKTAYEMRISDWSSDVCSADLGDINCWLIGGRCWHDGTSLYATDTLWPMIEAMLRTGDHETIFRVLEQEADTRFGDHEQGEGRRSEEHTSELQSLMRISYAVFCLKKKDTNKPTIETKNTR